MVRTLNSLLCADFFLAGVHCVGHALEFASRVPLSALLVFSELTDSALDCTPKALTHRIAKFRAAKANFSKFFLSPFF